MRTMLTVWALLAALTVTTLDKSDWRRSPARCVDRDDPRLARLHGGR